MMAKRSNGEGGIILPIVNRAAMVLEPAQAYLEWVRECPEAMPHLTLKELGGEGTVYLIPETNDNPDKWLRRNFVAMFENELEAWYMDRVFWPKDRSFKAFKKFFKVRFCSIVLDLGKGSLEKD
jgi:hypothetical protein